MKFHLKFTTAAAANTTKKRKKRTIRERLYASKIFCATYFQINSRRNKPYKLRTRLLANLKSRDIFVEKIDKQSSFLYMEINV